MTDEELIAEWLKENEVTKVPRGKSGFLPLRWNGNALRTVMEDGTFMTGEQRIARAKRRNPASMVVTKRRARVRELAHRMTISDIAKELGVSYDTAKRDLDKLGLRSRTRTLRTPEQVREAVRQALSEGCQTAHEVTKVANVSYRTAQRYMDEVHD